MDNICVNKKQLWGNKKQLWGNKKQSWCNKKQFGSNKKQLFLDYLYFQYKRQKSSVNKKQPAWNKNNSEVIKDNLDVIKNNLWEIKNNSGVDLVSLKNNLDFQIIVFYSFRGGVPPVLKSICGLKSNITPPEVHKCGPFELSGSDWLKE